MRKLLLIMAACGLLYLPSAAWAQEEKSAETVKSAEKSPAEAEYSKAMADLRQKMKEVRKEIKTGNSALAASLGQTEAYDEKEVKARYAELGQSQEKLAALELEALLLYKKHNPSWKPDTNGRKVMPESQKKSSKRKKRSQAED